MEKPKYDREVDFCKISSASSKDFVRLEATLQHTFVVALDAEWKPVDAKENVPKASKSYFPPVCLLQIACLRRDGGNPVVFLLDLCELKSHPTSIPKFHKLIKDMFESENIVKLGCGFRQDLSYLSSTFQFHFQPHGCAEGFNRVGPYLDINDVYKKRLSRQGKTLEKQRESLAVICEEFFGSPLSKKHQLDDWSKRPLEEEQMKYAALDVYCLVEMLDVYCGEVLGDVVEPGLPLSESTIKTITMDKLLQIVRNCGGIDIVLKDTDSQPKSSRMYDDKGQSSAQLPWDCSSGGDGRPKFLCDAMVVGLARLLRVAGIDTTIADREYGDESSGIADLIKQAKEEGRVLLTSKHWKRNCPNYHKLKGHFKSDAHRDEVFKFFGLEENKDQMARCTNCNKGFKQHFPLTSEQAIEAATGYSIDCWCRDCQDTYQRFLYFDEEKGVVRLDYMWLEIMGCVY